MRRYLLFAILAICCLSLSANAKPVIDHLEPMNWWVGMKNPNLQLMVHGKDISSLTPEINYEGVSLNRITKVKSPNYLFLDLTIAPQTKAGTFTIKFKKGKKVVLSHQYALLDRAENSANRQGFNNADVIYLITPDRFANGNPDNDTVKGYKDGLDRANTNGRHGGDIQGMMDHLDYIKDMGFTAIWPQPLVENAQDQTSYHGYSITDFYHIDPRFGSNEQYKALSAEVHKKGMKLVMDMVFNHCGSGHWWMKDLPTNDWLNYQQEGFHRCNHMRTTSQDPHASKFDRQEMVGGWFDTTMPDLNQKNPLMARYLIQNSIWWIEYANLSGIRMDTYPYPDSNFMAEWTKEVMNEYPHFNIVGEEWSVNPAIVSYWQKDKVNANGYTSYLPSLMDFPMQDAVVRALNEKQKDKWSDMWLPLYEMLSNDFLYPHPDQLTIFPDNHDMSRFFSQVHEDYNLFKLGITYFLTTRGIPQIYYGTEILKTAVDDHGKIRSDFPGGWAGDKINGFTGEGLTAQQKDAQAFMKKILNWRQSAEAVHHGKMIHFAPYQGVYVYFRMLNDKMVMVVLNKNAEQTEVDLSRFAEVLGSAPRSGKELFSGQTVDLSQKLTVPAMAPMVIDIN